jgi:hypothetical protein
MKSLAYALMFVASTATAQLFPPAVFQKGAQEDAESRILSVECNGKPYVCRRETYYGIAAYKEDSNNKEHFTYCTPEGECQSTVINRPKRRTQDINRAKKK